MTTDNHDSAAQGSTLRLALRSIDEKRAAAFRVAERDHAFDSRNLLRDAIARVEAMEAKLVEARADAPEADDHKPDSIPVAELAQVLGCDADATSVRMRLEDIAHSPERIASECPAPAKPDI